MINFIDCKSDLDNTPPPARWVGGPGDLKKVKQGYIADRYMSNKKCRNAHLMGVRRIIYI